MQDFLHLSTHRYQVRLPGSLSASGPREGLLLRVQWTRTSEPQRPILGYSDLMCWPELGDLRPEEEILAILAGKPTRLGRRALEMSQMDAEARLKGQSLWHDVEEPPASHFLAGNLGDLSQLDLYEIASRGFRCIKVKWNLAHAVPAPESLLRAALQRVSDTGMRLRIDFNGTATPSLLHPALASLERSLQRTIDYLEDPFPESHLESWRGLRELLPEIPLFVDRAEVDSSELLHLADGWVLKPALQDSSWLIRLRELRKFCTYTQYLGHAVGAAFAAWHAARAAQEIPEFVLDSGLLFESEILGMSAPFSKALKPIGSRFPTDELRRGTGIGWSEADFEALSWEPWR